MKKHRAKVHLKRWAGKRAACGVRTHMVTSAKRGSTRQVRLVVARRLVTCQECLRVQVA